MQTKADISREQHSNQANITQEKLWKVTQKVRFPDPIIIIVSLNKHWQIVFTTTHFYNEIISNYDISSQEKLGGGNLPPHKDKTRTRLENNQGGVMGGVGQNEKR